MEKTGKVLSAIGIGVLLVGATALIGHSIDANSTQSKIAKITADDTAKFDSAKIANDKVVSDLSAQLAIKPTSVTSVVEKNVTVEVPVDNGNLDSVEQFIWDNSGNIEFITHDLKEKEIAQITDRIVFVNDIKSMAVSDVKDKAFDKLDDKTVGGVTFNMKKMSELRVYDDASDITLQSVDFKYKDADAIVKAKFTYDDEDRYDVTFIVSYDKNEFDTISIDSIVKE